MDKRTKQDLLEDLVHVENELSLLKAMYVKAAEERADYAFLLVNIAQGYKSCAIHVLEMLKDMDYLFSTWRDGVALENLLKKIKGE